jgi:methylenetetrahydrofolate dehydrogenase (NADP+)/methenyltetrahydrofolate cyclohydrolase
MARLIDGKALAAALREQVAAAAAQLRERRGVVPGLAAVLVGHNPASEVYVRSKARACRDAGIASFEHHLPADCDMAALLARIAALNADDRVDGILVQLPLPAALDQSRIIAALDPAKDVDGFHPVNVGLLWSGQPSLVPCTPQGVMLLLRSVRPDLSGADAVVLGRSHIVGRPTVALLLAADCTVTIVHSRTEDAASICRRADILVAAIGRPGMITADWVKPGAIVVDVGINRIAGLQGTTHQGATHQGTTHQGATQLVGDVDFAAVQHVAGAVTPVPGGVGPMTIACLLRNTVLAAYRRRGLSEPAIAAGLR